MQPKYLLTGLAICTAATTLTFSPALYAGRRGNDNPFMPSAIPGIDDPMDNEMDVNDANDNMNGDNRIGMRPAPGMNPGAMPGATPNGHEHNHRHHHGHHGPGH